MPLFGDFLSIIVCLDIGDVEQLDGLFNAIGQVDIDISVGLNVQFFSLIRNAHSWTG